MNENLMQATFAMNGTFKRQSALASLAGAVAADSGHIDLSISISIRFCFLFCKFVRLSALDSVRAASKDTLRAVKKTCGSFHVVIIDIALIAIVRIGSCANNKARHKATMSV